MRTQNRRTLNWHPMKIRAYNCIRVSQMKKPPDIRRYVGGLVGCLAAPEKTEWQKARIARQVAGSSWRIFFFFPLLSDLYSFAMVHCQTI